MTINRDFFEDLFVLEMANNHWGRVDRGIAIIDAFAKVARYNGVRASIKLQFRDVDTFVHRDHRDREDVRYIKKTVDTKMSKNDYRRLVDHIRKSGCIPTATPFDEASVDLIEALQMPFIKIASSDINDWVLIERIAKTKLPVIASTGGSSIKDVDDIVSYFEKRNLNLAINHCVSLYPSEDDQLELNQVDFLRNRYPNVTIGFSTHEYQDWNSSIMMAYAKGARTFERHIDIDADGIAVSPYCSTPEQCDVWFKAFKKAKEMCGSSGESKRIPPRAEVEYLDALVRGVYLKHDVNVGHRITDQDVYLAIPLLKGQLSYRELVSGDLIIRDIKAHDPLTIGDIDNPYSRTPSLRTQIENRGL